ncbi:MAG: sel1 repeat family protein [Lachnospiraceae bacterium]|nr:sel1 repeat family protein [Lachnospiraceae bacterium]
MKKKKPVTDEDKKEFIRYYSNNEDELEMAGSNIRAAYKESVEYGLEKDWIEALNAKAYGCYGGNCVFDCDWEESKKCLLKLVELDGENNPFYYNTLGYIYYYGRCNKGVPQYDEAFKYFSVGAIAGIYESRYKIADMMISGNGALKNKGCAANIIISMYDDNYDIFCKGSYNGKFADISLRMGNLYEEGIGVEKNLELAYYHYVQARYAIDLRSRNSQKFGDTKVAEKINKAYERVRKQLPKNFFKKYMEFDNPAIFGLMLQGASGLDIELSYRKGRYYMRAKTLAAENDISDNLITVSEMEFCELADEVEVELFEISDISTDEFPAKAFITHIMYNDDDDRWEFYHGDFELLSFKCSAFIFRGRAWRDTTALWELRGDKTE